MYYKDAQEAEVKLDNEFVVAAPLDRTWSTLLDLDRVAGCLPGATLEPSAGDGTYRGGMKVKLGPMVVSYDGVARMVDVDEDDHTSTLEVQGKETKGQGTAAATIRNRLEDAGDGRTRVRVETELQVTGRQAQFGRGIMEDVAGRMLREFAGRLEQLILTTGDTERTAVNGRPDWSAAPPSGERAGAGADDVLDLGSVATGALQRYAPLGAGLLIALLALLIPRVGRRRRRLRIKLDLTI
jgi:carbon monoxide dehydrogenase subunit G